MGFDEAALERSWKIKVAIKVVKLKLLFEYFSAFECILQKCVRAHFNGE